MYMNYKKARVGLMNKIGRPRSSNPKAKTLIVRVEPFLYEKVVALSKRRNVSVGQVVRDAVRVVCEDAKNGKE